MTGDIITDSAQIRGTDSNSLLRSYDRACSVAATSVIQQERIRADKARQRIARELAKRKIPL
jgi:hypothetical protein